MKPRERWILAAILILALFIRVGWSLLHDRSPATINQLPDQCEYLSLGDALLRDHQLRLFDARFGQAEFAYRLPGYPVLIAACDNSVLTVRLVQAMVDTSTVLAIFLIARRMCGNAPGGLAAAATVAVNPLFIYFSGLLLTETLFAAAVAWAVYAALCRATLGVVAALVVAVYLRPTALLLGPILAIVGANPKDGRAYHWRLAVLVPVAMVLALLPWAARNWVRLGTPIWTTTNDGITFYDGFHEGATGASDQRFVERLPGLRSMNEVERSRDLGHRARTWAAEHLNLLPKLALRKVLRGWSPVPLSQEFGRPLYRWVGGTYAVPFDVSCLLGLWSRRLRRWDKALLVTPAVVLTVVQVLTVGSIRYRMPAEAPLAVLAAVGATDLGRWLKGLLTSTDAPAGHYTAPPV